MRDDRYIPVFAACGAGVFVLLNILTKGAVPGGFIGGFIGALVGGAIGFLLLTMKMMKKK